MTLMTGGAEEADDDACAFALAHCGREQMPGTGFSPGRTGCLAW